MPEKLLQLKIKNLERALFEAQWRLEDSKSKVQALEKENMKLRRELDDLQAVVSIQQEALSKIKEIITSVIKELQ
jgi:regulator of replication initiation timing